MVEHTKKHLNRLDVNTRHILPVYAGYFQGASIKNLEELDQYLRHFFMTDRPKVAIKGWRKLVLRKFGNILKIWLITQLQHILVLAMKIKICFSRNIDCRSILM
jgi:hypothetical protein